MAAGSAASRPSASRHTHGCTNAGRGAIPHSVRNGSRHRRRATGGRGDRSYRRRPPRLAITVLSDGLHGDSRPLVRVVIHFADDRGDALLAGDEVIAPVAVAAEAAVLAQRVERAGDVAAVLAAERLDHVGVEHRPGGERLLDRLEARRAGEHLGGAARPIDLARAAEPPRAGETQLLARLFPPWGGGPGVSP